MSEHIETIFLAAFFFPAAAAVLVFFMKYVSAILQARVRLGQDEAYRELATKAALAQTEIAAALASLGTALAEIQSRLAVVEKVLKDVECVEALATACVRRPGRRLAHECRAAGVLERGSAGESWRPRAPPRARSRRRRSPRSA